MGDTKKRHGGVPVDHSGQLPRLRRIEGQVRGVHQMIEGGRDCVEVAHQISAVVAALRRVQGDMLRAHIAACAEAAVGGKMSDKEAKRVAEEIGGLLARLC